MKVRLLALAVAGCTVAGSAFAAPFAPFDVRAMGMGGAGVAGAKSASAALYNPAMLSMQVEGDKFQFAFGAGASVADPNDLLDQIDNLQKTGDEITRLANLVSGASIALDSPTANTNLISLAQNTQTLIGQLNSANGDNVISGIGGGLGVGVPGKKLGVGVFVTANGTTAVAPAIAPADIATLSNYVAIFSDGKVSTAEATANTSLIAAAAGTVNSVSDFNAQSSATGAALMLAETGVSLSHAYDLGAGQLAVGVTPKYMSAITFEYTTANNSIDNFKVDDSSLKATDKAFGLDAGVVFKDTNESPWQFGLSVKNLIGQSFQTKSGGSIKVSPQARAGASRMTEHTTLAVDLDLSKNNGVAPRTDTQFLALGAEYDLKFFQIRAGYRANLANGDVPDAMSVGLGLGPIDLAVYGSDREVSGNLQLGFGW